MAYKLAVDDLVGVTIKGKMFTKDGREKEFKFVLVCDRLNADALRNAIADRDENTSTFFARHAKDWQGQTLVLGDDDQPAPFSPEALSVLMSMTGMANLCWHSYIQQVQATAKN